MTSYDERQSAALSASLGWLEDELREAKLLILKQQQSLESANAQIWELTTALHKVEDVVAALAPRLEVLPEYDSQLRQLKDTVAGQHEQSLATEKGVLDLARLRQAESDRDRAVLNDLSHRLESAERAVSGTAPRFEALDEAGRRALESVAFVRQRLEELDRGTTALEGRLGRVVEATGRTDHEFTRLNAEIDTLRRQDETIAERVQVYTELIKRLEAQLSLVAADVAVKQDTLERIELHRLEVHRLEERLSVLEATGEDLRERDEFAARQMAVLEGRDKGLADRLTGLQAEFATYRTLVAEQFQRIHQSQERTKRRQIEEIEREIREMRVHAFRPVEE
jgi:chromosome segregation ATPase